MKSDASAVKDADWTVLHNSDSHIIRWRRCLADGVVKIQAWSTNPGYGDKGIVTLEIGSWHLREIVAAITPSSVGRARRHVRGA